MKTKPKSTAKFMATMIITLLMASCQKEIVKSGELQPEKDAGKFAYRVTMKGDKQIVEKFTLSEAIGKFSKSNSSIALSANTGYYNSKGKVFSEFIFNSLFDPEVPHTWFLTVLSKCEIRQTHSKITGYINWNPDTNVRYNGSADFEPTGIYIKSAGSGLKAVIESRMTEDKGFLAPEGWENYYFYYCLYDTKSSAPDEYLWSYWLTPEPLDFLADPDGEAWNGAEWFPVEGYIEIKD